MMPSRKITIETIPASSDRRTSRDTGLPFSQFLSSPKEREREGEKEKKEEKRKKKKKKRRWREGEKQ
jgi:hypothetical protein